MTESIEVLDHGFARLVSHTGHIGASVVDAARCSYGSAGDNLGPKDQALIKYLLANGHTSPFRHAFFTFHVKAPLFVIAQWGKYQVGSTWRTYETEDGQPVAAVDLQYDTDKGCSWNQISGRYKVMDAEFYHPDVWRGQSGKQAGNATLDQVTQDYEARAYAAWCREATARYEKAIESGVAKEMARLYLPPSIYSECYWTVSLQAVLHFLDQRIKPEAQWEIRQYAASILTLIKPHLGALGVNLD